MPAFHGSWARPNVLDSLAMTRAAVCFDVGVAELLLDAGFGVVIMGADARPLRWSVRWTRGARYWAGHDGKMGCGEAANRVVQDRLSV